ESELVAGRRSRGRQGARLGPRAAALLEEVDSPLVASRPAVLEGRAGHEDAAVERHGGPQLIERPGASPGELRPLRPGRTRSLEDVDRPGEAAPGAVRRGPSGQRAVAERQRKAELRSRRSVPGGELRLLHPPTLLLAEDVDRAGVRTTGAVRRGRSHREGVAVDGDGETEHVSRGAVACRERLKPVPLAHEDPVAEVSAIGDDVAVRGDATAELLAGNGRGTVGAGLLRGGDAAEEREAQEHEEQTAASHRKISDPAEPGPSAGSRSTARPDVATFFSWIRDEYTTKLSKNG